MHLLHNRVQGYAWGSVTAIPELLGVAPTGEPQAELWMGAHPQLPSLVDVGGERVSLAELIASDPVRALGPWAIARFGPELPFLCKVLAAEEPLSLQAHPSKEQAAEGHAREERAGIAATASNRSYRDQNHKPELLCAMTRFEALCGFRPGAEAVEVLAALAGPLLRPWVDALARHPSEDGRRLFLGQLLTLPRHQAAGLVEELAGNAGAAPDPDDGRLLLRLAAVHPSDPGVVVAALLNRLVLEPGEALFLGPGNLHAYVEGVGVEVMASSDNVLRGGLTPKPVDVQELLRILDVEAGRPPVLRARTGGPDSVEAVYETPAHEFVLSVTRVEGGAADLEQAGPSIVLCTDGAVEVGDDGDRVHLGRGGAAFVPASVPRFTVRGAGTLHRVTTPS